MAQATQVVLMQFLMLPVAHDGQPEMVKFKKEIAIAWDDLREMRRILEVSSLLSNSMIQECRERKWVCTKCYKYKKT